MNMLLLVVVLYSLMAIKTAFETVPFYKQSALTYTELYNCTSLNKFGCIVLTICLTLINPILAIIKFFDWIFHINRKE